MIEGLLVKNKKPDIMHLTGFALVCVLCVAFIAARSVQLSYEHSLHSIDGAMQTWFSLWHFAHGQALGADFQSYLGVTLFLPMLVLFWAFGGTLFASTLAATTMVLFGVIAQLHGTLRLTRLVPVRARWLVLFGLFGLLFYAAEAVTGLETRRHLAPGNSLRILRASLPFLMLPLTLPLLTGIRNEGHAFRRGVCLGVIAGFGLLWSNDAGIPAFGSLFLAIGFCLLRTPKSLLAAWAGYLPGSFAAAALILLIATHGAPSSWISYNFGAIPKDQIWYFAPWAPQYRVLQPTDIINLFSDESSVTLVILGTCLCIAIIRRLRGRGAPVRTSCFIFVAMSTLGTAILPQIGGHIDSGYNNGAAIPALLAPFFIFERRILALVRWARWLWGMPFLVTMITLSAMITIGIEWPQQRARMANNAEKVMDDVLGFHLDQSYMNDVQAIRKLHEKLSAAGIPDDRQLMSTYTSALDAGTGVVSPTSYGSIIHALGPVARAKFNSVVEDRWVAAVTTVYFGYSPWAHWNVRSSWSFFRALNEGYTPIGRNNQHVLWMRNVQKTDRRINAEATCTISEMPDGRARLTVQTDTSGWAELVAHQVTAPLEQRSAILMVTETSPYSRELARKVDTDPQTWLDFPNYGAENLQNIHLVVPVEPDIPSVLDLTMLNGQDIVIDQCNVQLYSLHDEQNLPSLPEAIGTLVTKEVN